MGGGVGGGEGGDQFPGEAAACLRIFFRQFSPLPSILRDSGTSGEKIISKRGGNLSD